MRSRVIPWRRFRLWAVSFGVLCAVLFAVPAQAQTNSNERAFPQSKATVEKALTALEANLAGHLPVLDGFAKPGEHPLDRYQRAYYQSTVQVSSTASGGSLVRVSTKVTAWYADAVASRSGYQLVTSNGRLEADLLDQLGDQLAQPSQAATESGSRTSSNSAPKPSAAPPAETEPTISAPAPASKFPESERTFSSSLSRTPEKIGTCTAPM